MRPRPIPLALSMLLGLGIGPLAARAAADQLPDYAKDRAEMAQQLTEPFNWLSLVALQWVKPGAVTTVGSAPGNTLVLAGLPAHALSLSLVGDKVKVDQAAAALQYQGKPLAAGTELSGEEDDKAAVSVGTVRLWAIQRGDAHYLRVKDSNAPARLHFHGLRWYAPDPRFRVTARWVPFDKPHTFTTHNQIGQSYDTTAPGYAEFTLDGKTERLLPFAATDQYTWFVFRDETFRSTTYGGGRFLYAGKPSNGYDHPGTLIIDFNEAYNPPCAFSPFATCPLAAPENRLPISVPAGEKRYQDEAEATPARNH